MRLTGLSPILLTGTLAVLAAVVLVRLWPVAGSWRLPVRVTGLVLVEALVVLIAGLIANRVDGFYPSWQALTGDTGTAVRSVSRPPGRLDASLAAGGGLSWTPAGDTAWRLAAPLRLIPPSGYEQRPDHAFPVIVALADAGQAPPARHRATSVPDAVILVITPTPATTAADLATLPERLERDARVTSSGWAIVADRRFATLAGQWRALAPEQFPAASVTDGAHLAAALDSIARQLPAPLAAPLMLPS
jgi:lysyl-tRNA synthetase class 2